MLKSRISLKLEQIINFILAQFFEINVHESKDKILTIFMFQSKLFKILPIKLFTIICINCLIYDCKKLIQIFLTTHWQLNQLLWFNFTYSLFYPLVIAQLPVLTASIFLTLLLISSDLASKTPNEICPSFSLSFLFDLISFMYNQNYSCFSLIQSSISSTDLIISQNSTIIIICHTFRLSLMKLLHMLLNFISFWQNLIIQCLEISLYLLQGVLFIFLHFQNFPDLKIYPQNYLFQLIIHKSRYNYKRRQIKSMRTSTIFVNGRKIKYESKLTQYQRPQRNSAPSVGMQPLCITTRCSNIVQNIPQKSEGKAQPKLIFRILFSFVSFLILCFNNLVKIMKWGLSQLTNLVIFLWRNFDYWILIFFCCIVLLLTIRFEKWAFMLWKIKKYILLNYGR